MDQVVAFLPEWMHTMRTFPRGRQTWGDQRRIGQVAKSVSSVLNLTYESGHLSSQCDKEGCPTVSVNHSWIWTRVPGTDNRTEKSSCLFWTRQHVLHVSVQHSVDFSADCVLSCVVHHCTVLAFLPPATTCLETVFKWQTDRPCWLRFGFCLAFCTSHISSIIFACHSRTSGTGRRVLSQPGNSHGPFRRVFRDGRLEDWVRPEWTGNGRIGHV